MRHVFIIGKGRGISAPLWSLLICVGVAGLVLAPLFSLFSLAFQRGFNTNDVLARVLPSALWETIGLLGGVSIVTALIGISTAWCVTAYRFPGRRWMMWLLPLPLAVPTYLSAYIYVELLDSGGILQIFLRHMMGWTSRRDYWFPDIRSLGGCIFVMGLVLYPYVYLAARAVFVMQSASLLEAARLLGAGRWQVFKQVVLPLSRPALAIGLSLALLEALNDVGAGEYLSVRTLTVSVYVTWLNRGDLAGAAQLACLMLMFVTVLIALEHYGRRSRVYASSPKRMRPLAPLKLQPVKGFLAFMLCLVPVILGFGIPLVFLLDQVLERSLWQYFDQSFLRILGMSVGFAGIATALILLLGLILVTSARFARSFITSLSRIIAGFGYTVPGTVLALGLLMPLIWLDGVIFALLHPMWKEAPRLILISSGAALIIAYCIRFLPLATGSLDAALKRVSASIDDAARLLGASSQEIVMRIQLPLMRTALAGAALLVFVDCLKELPATLLLRPLNVETLPTFIYAQASRGAFEDGALAAIIIILLSVIPVIVFSRGHSR
jgi:iron(III) transport system permease protein